MFLFQFRRCAFVAVEFLWDVMYNLVERRKRWPCVATDLLVTVFLLPLLVIHFRLEVSGLVSCSDASQDGAGICVARSLTAAGEEAYRRAVARVANLGRGIWVLVESFAGIGTARYACHLLGLKPSLYIAIEKSEEALSVLTFHWKDAVIFRDIRHVTVEELLPLVASVPHARLVLHAGGSPCPGFCRWNPFSEGAQRHESEHLLAELRRETLLSFDL